MSRDNLVSGFSKVANLGVGVVTVSPYGAAKDAGVNLGMSDGGIAVELSAKFFDVKVDNALGVVKRFKTDEAAKLTFNVAESTLANLALALGLPSGAVAGSVLSHGGDFTLTDYTIYIDVNGPGDGTREIKIFYCNIIGDAKHAYKKGALTMIPITIECMEDITRTVGDRVLEITDSPISTTPPTVVMSTPAPGGTVAKTTKGTVVFTITDTLDIDDSSIVLGQSVLIQNVTTIGTPVEVAGAIVVDKVAKTITFTPSSAWNASDSLLAIITTDLKDVAGNKLAAPYLAHFTVTA